MKLILIALVPLVLIALSSMAGLGTNFVLSNGRLGQDSSQVIYYDYYGNPTAYANGTAYRTGDTGTWEDAADGLGWHNESVTFYYLFWDTGGQSHIKYDEAGQSFPTGAGMNMTIQGSVMFFGLITALIVIGLLVGARFLTYGQSDETVSLILKGTAFGSLWAIFSVFAYSVMIGSGEFILQVTYIALSLIYTLGVINSFGHPSGDF